MPWRGWWCSRVVQPSRWACSGSYRRCGGTRQTGCRFLREHVPGAPTRGVTYGLLISSRGRPQGANQRSPCPYRAGQEDGLSNKPPSIPRRPVVSTPVAKRVFRSRSLSPDDCKLRVRSLPRGDQYTQRPHNSPALLRRCSGPCIRWYYDGSAGRDHHFVMQVPMRPATASVARPSGPMMTRALSPATLLRKSIAPWTFGPMEPGANCPSSSQR